MKIRNMKDILYSVSDELLSVRKDLAVHVCGSHVLRFWLCILGGVEETLHLVTKSSELMRQIMLFGLSGKCRGSHSLEALLRSANDDFFLRSESEGSGTYDTVVER